MMKRLFLTFAVAAVALCGVAQNDNDVLMTVGNETITKGQFVNAYQKNNLLSNATEKDLREYLDLFVNYRLKVQDATAAQMDTAKAFRTELESYKNQSAQQYLIDTEVSDFLLEEAFERSKYQVNASHILFRCEQNASPKDTMAAYQKALTTREKIMNGLDFNEAAYLYSEDESARDYMNPQTQRMHPGNRGRLGYFSVMEMIYPFESAAYNTPVGSVSMPIRTQFGYHLIYVHDKVPAMSKVFVSQIFVKDTNALMNVSNAKVKAKLDEIQKAYKSGKTFEELAALYSEDVATKNVGGKMDPFVPSRRPGNYVAAAINLKPGEISEPVPTTLGWHILKLDSIVYMVPSEESKFLLKNRLSRDVRAKKSKESLIAKLKVEYNYQEPGKAAAMKFFGKNIPDTYFQSTALDIETLKGLQKLKPMCTYADQTLTAADFAHYVSRFQGSQLKGTVRQFLEEIFPNFVNENMIRYEHSRLMDKYPEYKELVNEFHDGMLLYEINSEKVWNAAIQDTVGLEKFYETIKSEYPVDAPNDSIQFKPMSEIRAIVVSRYQDYLDNAWIQELRSRYPVKIDEKVFQSILKK